MNLLSTYLLLCWAPPRYLIRLLENAVKSLPWGPKCGKIKSEGELLMSLRCDFSKYIDPPFLWKFYKNLVKYENKTALLEMIETHFVTADQTVADRRPTRRG